MDVRFETQKGSSFTIEIGYFDTVKEIKEKIQKTQDIDTSLQTLVFNGKILEDDGDVESCCIFDNSCIQLLIAAQNESMLENAEIKVKDEQID